MNTEDFENQLRRVPMREIPAEWRGEILRRTEGGGRKAEKERTGSWWRDLLWPCPQAWAALACIWMGIGILNFSTPHTQTPSVAKASGEALMVRLAQERSLSENKGMF